MWRRILVIVVGTLHLVPFSPAFADDACFSVSEWFCERSANHLVLSRTHYLLSDNEILEEEHHFTRRAELMAFGDVQRLIDGVLGFENDAIELFAALCDVEILELALASIRMENNRSRLLCREGNEVLVRVEVNIMGLELETRGCTELC